MPESSGQAESDRQQRTARSERNQSSSNIVSAISQFADDHLKLLQNISTGLAVAGLVIIGRSIKLISKFRLASEIPSRFIERNVSLRGKVHSVSEQGLKVEHVPIDLPLLSPLLSKYKGEPEGSSSPLRIHLAGVDMTAEGRIWLQENLAPAQTVWLKLISREQDVLYCLVSQGRQGTPWSLSLNEELLRLGLARTAPVTGVLPGSVQQWRVHKRLHRAERKAERKGWGLWKEDSPWERTFWDNALYRWIKRTFKRT